MPITPSATDATSSPGAHPAAALVAESVACWRGGRRLFSGLQLRVSAGEAVWLRGPNGCGKTSLLRLLAGLVRPESGHILFDGQPAHRLEPPQRARLRFMGHANALKDTLPVSDALGFLCRLGGDAVDLPRLEAALARFDVAQTLHRPVRTLSQGQRRKAALARLLLAPAGTTWLLDEPYDALDTRGCQILEAVLAERLAAGGSLVLTSHLPVTLAGVRAFDLDRIGQPDGAMAVAA